MYSVITSLRSITNVFTVPLLVDYVIIAVECCCDLLSLRTGRVLCRSVSRVAIMTFELLYEGSFVIAENESLWLRCYIGLISTALTRKCSLRYCILRAVLVLLFGHFVKRCSLIVDVLKIYYLLLN